MGVGEERKKWERKYSFKDKSKAKGNPVKCLHGGKVERAGGTRGNKSKTRESKILRKSPKDTLILDTISLPPGPLKVIICHLGYLLGCVWRSLVRSVQGQHTSFVSWNGNKI